ncbi:MAG: peptidase M15 [Bacteroidales bacterium]|nr:peptidase M15 [Bacteroidales bacterium]
MQYFTIDEFTRSDITAIHGIDNSPSLYAIGNLTALVINVLDPVRAAMGKPICVTSGYRCPELNARIAGASSDSQHTKGEAADIVIAKGGKWDNHLLGCAIVRLGNFDQVIFENVGKDDLLPDWIHVSWKRTGTNRHEIRKHVKGSGPIEQKKRKTGKTIRKSTNFGQNIL